MTDEAARLVAKCPQLEAVSFAGCGKLTDIAANHLWNCPQLKCADFSGCPKATEIPRKILRSLTI